MERRRYTPEFKREAVELSETAGKAVCEVARQLGIAPKLLYRWRSEMLGRARRFRGVGGARTEKRSWRG